MAVQGTSEQFNSVGSTVILSLCLYPGIVYLADKTEPIMTSGKNKMLVRWDGQTKNGQRMDKE